MPTAGGIIDQVDSFDLPKGLDNALKVKLQKALEAVEDGDIDTACSELGAFVNHVEAHADKKLTVEQAQELLDAAALLADQFGCPSTDGPIRSVTASIATTSVSTGGRIAHSALG